jgi:hypothetical protein
MKIDSNLAARGGEARETRAEKTIRLLLSLDGDPKQQKLREFEKFYPAVLQAKARKVPRKTILKHLGEAGLKLYPALFEELMTAMAQVLGGLAEPLACSHCGQPIHNGLARDEKQASQKDGLTDHGPELLDESAAAGELV